jgi:putative hydrolase of the HAD superfamily
MIDTSQIKAVGFDVDGTLYNIPDEMSIDVSNTVTQKAAQLLGRDVDDFEEEYVKKREELRSNTLTLLSFGLDGEKIFQQVIDEFPLEKYIKKDQKLISVIAGLKKKYRLFIITNGSGRQVERKLKLIGLDKNDFSPRIYAYDQGWVKPEPAPYLAALEDLQLPAEQTIYIGDREDVDLEGAKAVGMKTLYIRGKSDAADAYVDSVYDIEQVLLPA